MTGCDVILVGGGEHACVVADAAQAADFRILGYTDNAAGAMAERLYGLAWLGSDAAACAAHPGARFILAMGDVRVRARVADILEARGCAFASIVHPRATVARSAVLEAGVIVLAGALVNPGARIGAHAIVNTGAIVEHDVLVERLVHLAPGVAIGGGARIGARSVVGLGARVRDHIVLGEDVFVGMGAAVVTSVDPGTTVTGIPARPTRNHAPLG